MRVYRASALGSCLRAQVATQLDFRAIEDRSGKMDRMSNEGELHEQDVVRQLTQRGGFVSWRQKEVSLGLSPAFDVVGHIDGIYHAEPQSVEFVLEVKSMSKDAYDEFLAKHWDTPGLVQRYKWQISAYMLSLNLPCYFAVKNRNDGRLHTEILYTPFYTREEIMARVLRMEAMVRKGELPKECDVHMFPCPFFYLHEVVEADVAGDDIIDGLAEMYEDARLEVKIAETKQKEARKALDTAMGERERVVTEKVKVTYYQRKSNVFNVNKAKEALGEDAVKEFMEDRIYKGLRVTVKENSERESRGDASGTESDPTNVRNDSETPDAHGAP